MIGLGSPLILSCRLKEARDRFLRYRERLDALGDLDATVHAAHRVQDVGSSIADRRLQCYAQCILAVVACYGDDAPAALVAAGQALGRAPDPLANSVGGLFLAEACLEAGRLETARDHARTAHEALDNAGLLHLAAWAASHLADAELALGNPQAARVTAENVLARTSERFFPQGRARALRTLARLADGGVDLSMRRLDDALRSFDAIGARFEAARTRLAIARLARSIGADALAREHVSAALEMFRAVSAPKYVGLTEALLAEILDGSQESTARVAP